MKNNKIESITYNSNGELVIKFEGKSKAETKKESEMTDKEKEIKNFLQAQSNRSISANGEFKDNSSTPGKKGKDGTAALLRRNSVSSGRNSHNGNYHCGSCQQK